MLDWGSNLDFATFVPLATVLRRELGASLPYLSCTFDVTALPRKSSAAQLHEARRVARSWVMITDDRGGFELQRGEASPANSALIPSVSIIIPVRDKLELTRDCLKALQSTLIAHTSIEVIVVNDGSTDDTAAFLETVSEEDCRYRILTNRESVGFIESCNRGAAEARLDVVVFLNNDTIPFPGWLDALVDTFASNPRVGAVGAKLLYPDGTLQEAGSVVFSDGSAMNFGRGSHEPDDPLFSYVREVDYCSGAVLATPRSLFLDLGGFDTRYRPAYYEDADYCLLLRQNGYKVLFQPDCQVIHIEGGTAGTDLTCGPKSHQTRNHKIFFEKWKDTLALHPAPPESMIEFADLFRFADANKPRILVISYTVPEYDKESGSKRLYDLVCMLLEEGWSVTFLTMKTDGGDSYLQELRAMGVATYRDDLENPSPHGMYETRTDFLLVNGSFDVALIGFWHIAEAWIPRIRTLSPDTRTIIDSVDLHFVRNLRLALKTSPDGKIGGWISPALGEELRRELNVYALADRVLTVSDTESGLINSLILGPQRAFTVPDCETLGRSPIPFDERRGILFVGNFRHPPNVEAIYWLIRDIVPLIDPEVLREHPISIIGTDMTDEIKRFGENAGLKMIGWVPSVEPYLERARLSILPLLHGAGTKRKLIQASMIGTPSVATRIAVEGFPLVHEEDILIADDPGGFVEAITRLLHDRASWHRFARSSREKMLVVHGTEATRGSLSAALDFGSDATAELEWLSFRCNICETDCRARLEQLERETPSCTQCGSTVRFRAIVSVLSRELFGASLSMSEFPQRRDIRGIGLSDWEGYAGVLKSKLSYQNTYLHQEPLLDITNVPESMEGTLDFIISSDVFEHVVPPVSSAFENARRLLKPGGFMILTVPYVTGAGVATVEHFPRLHEYQTIPRKDGSWAVLNTTSDGVSEIFENVTFHGGAGLALEMRLFSEEGLLRDLEAAGFRNVSVADEPDYTAGVFWTDAWSLPLVARK